MYIYIYIYTYTFLFHSSYASAELRKGLRNMRKQMEFDRASDILECFSDITTLRKLVSLRCLADRIKIIFFQVCTLNFSSESGYTDYNTVTGYTRCISKIPFRVEY